MSRDTTTGEKFERKTGEVLARCGIPFSSQVHVGGKPGGGRHRVDHVVHRGNGQDLLVSCKTQTSTGTAEEKLPFELMKLAHTVTDDMKRWGEYAVLVVAGDGWSEGIKKMLEDDAWMWMPEARRMVRVYYSADDFVREEFPTQYMP